MMKGDCNNILFCETFLSVNQEIGVLYRREKAAFNVARAERNESWVCTINVTLSLSKEEKGSPSEVN